MVPIDARVDRIADVSVCVRPFRPAGPRVEPESLGDTLVVHNYGHGGSGWSLSWGSSTRAVRLAMQGSPRDVAVIGCGVLGLTSAILAQRAGARVTIYAREQLPLTTSFRATGEWTPDSRIALAHVAAPDFADVWEDMARTAFATHRGYIGKPGTPVEMVDQYAVSDESSFGSRILNGPSIDFASYGRRIADLMPPWQPVSPDASPFEATSVSRGEIMMFNITEYTQTLMSQFHQAGGQIQRADFQSPAEIAALGKKVVINCTGYGARALWQDDTLVPVRGQIAHLIPQPNVHYGVVYQRVLAVPRRDGIVVQSFEGGEAQGYGIAAETIDRDESVRAVMILAELFAPGRWRGSGLQAFLTPTGRHSMRHA
ncbi:MAG: FAD-binding oxidoreductase [Alphaproteobacteria bacterium]|nr:FAD-binding oxidoreductase [Alphaproteobacteria bacterium]MBV8407053.1 FAD-binding oxidoreductase [Alphaproteobacteria bacterium]